MLRVRSSRRAVALKPSDYDHEIGLVNHDEAPMPSPPTPAPDASRQSTSRLLSMTSDGQEQRDDDDDANTQARRRRSDARGRRSPMIEVEHQPSLPDAVVQPSIEIQAPTPDVINGPETPDRRGVASRRRRAKRETAIDILYENERGGLFCGKALFSSRALGGLDPPAWTNAYHKPSPTSIHTAQVPDPSWEWIWPEWRVNHEEGMDAAGWEYSFAFCKRFSWHGPKWWNSFVRRRAWIRKRAKKRPQDMPSDPHLLNTNYFTIRPASYHDDIRRRSRSSGSLGSSRVPSKTNLAAVSSSVVDDEEEEVAPDICDIDSLLHELRVARIDREKRELVENYIDHGNDLELLQGVMHEVMSLFIFQASRRQLLSHLMRKHDELKEQLGHWHGSTTGLEELRRRKEALDGAARHAGEEVRRLAYWSDVKRMAAEGELKELDELYEANSGLDGSGPREPNRGELP
ncbi:hypothetical protein CDD81_7339 [Ophiocordyceps australis]|uniref:Peroxin/Ferlin domain-containing protein n=1 Tax=Ophiocordyceps australis TaxID=1399860 RepID=A0A2C5Y4Q2_9HYPO|nr:hypothetical protein CDD81_7339 [Ophiocordyceps australis]